MDVATIALVLQYGLRYGPEAVAIVRRLLSGAAPAESDWAALEGILKKTGASYFAAPPNSTPTVP